MDNIELYNKILKIQKDNNISKDNLNRYIFNHYNDLYKELESKTLELNKFKIKKNDKIKDISIFERLFCIKNNLTDRPKCNVCKDKYVNRFIPSENRYSEWCSISCSCKDNKTLSKSQRTRLEKYGDVNYNNVSKAKETRLNKYGSFHNDNFSEKIKETKLERYGNENYVNVEKAKQTKLEKYGSETFNNYDKNKQTKLERYGNENYNNSKQIHETKLNFTEEKNNEINEKRKQTCLEKYNVSSIADIEEIKEKRKETCLKKYGHEYYFQSDINRLQSIKAIKEKSWNNSIINDDEYTPLFTKEDYINNNDSKTIFKWKHNKCGNIFETNYENGKHKLCPKCYPWIISGKSNEEKEIIDFVKSIYNGTVIENTKSVIKPLELDIYLPEKQIAFEFDGLFWHCQKDRNYHLNKNLKCEEQNIHLVHIFENEWLYKKEIIKSRIKNILGIFDFTVYARLCEVKEVDSKTSKQFQDENHIQGHVNSSVNLGLFYKDELISLMTFSKTRFSKKYEYELVRFCNKLGYHIPGSAGKLLKYFERVYKPKSLISYADRKWTMNNSKTVYNSLGFTLDHISNPDYWYFKTINRVLESRIKYQKHKLKNILEKFDENLSEYENMKLNNYYRIYDCGNLVYIKEY